MTNILTTVGKILGIITALSAYEDIIPTNYKWVGVAVFSVASTLKDVVAHFVPATVTTVVTAPVAASTVTTTTK